MADAKFKVALTVGGILVSAVTGYYSSLAAIGERVRATEVRQEEQFKALLDRINEVGSRTREGHDDIRMDLNAIRGEIMAMLREDRKR